MVSRATVVTLVCISIIILASAVLLMALYEDKEAHITLRNDESYNVTAILRWNDREAEVPVEGGHYLTLPVRWGLWKEVEVSVTWVYPAHGTQEEYTIITKVKDGETRTISWTFD